MKLILSAIASVALAAGTALAASPLMAAPPARTAAPAPIQPVDETSLTRLPGNTHPEARLENDLGKVDDGLKMDRVRLVLKRTPARQAALDAFVERLYDRKSPDFHKFISADAFGKTYGISDADLARVTTWLQGHGLSVYSVDKGRNFLQFSGDAAQVGEAFHVEMHRYSSEGKVHLANDRDPQIPTELASFIQGVASLHDFFPKPQHVWGGSRDPRTGEVRSAVAAKSASKTGSLKPVGQLSIEDNNGNDEGEVTPYDFATIYSVLPLWNAGITGAGQKIAISATTDINLNDVAYFRSELGLPTNQPTVVHNGSDPGITDSDSQGENTLDVEWSGAVAYNATVYLVVSASTSTTFGGDLSNEYIVDNQLATVTSASYGSCEIGLGTSGNAAENALYEQAVSEGIAAFESAGDQGSAGCDGHGGSAPYGAKYGVAVNGDASTPYETAVGGTDFNWYQPNTFSTYWSDTNSSTGESALSYIPEIPWNSTCASPVIAAEFGYTDLESFCNAAAADSTYDVLVNIAAGSGGVSSCTTSTGGQFSTCSGGYAKPSWQAGTGVPADGKRDLPDVSLFASAGVPDLPGSAYLVCISNNTNGGATTCDYSTTDGILQQLIGGTSVASPAMSGVMALVNQEVGASQGFANPVLYQLFQNENASSCASTSATNSSSCVFNDITTGNISEACTVGDIDCTAATSGDTYALLPCCGSTVGYDEATGLGSVNVYNLATKWKALVAAEVPTTTTLTVSPNPATVNTSVNFSVTVKKSSGSGTPTGSVKFYAGSTALSTVALSNGAAALNGVTFQSTGTYVISAIYSGDVADKTSTSNNVNEVIQAASVATTTSLTASPTSVATGGSVKFTATVKANSGSTTPAGTVSFTLNGASIGSATLSGGTASVTTTVSLAAGSYTAKATYAGATGFGASSGTTTVTVTAVSKVNTTTTMTASPNPITVNATGTLSATVKKASGTGTPTGSVTFYYGTTAISGAVALNTSGVASTSAQAAVPAGTYALHAVYSGDSLDNGSTSANYNETVQNVSKSNTTTTAKASPNPVKSGSTTGITVQVTGGSTTPTGTITFTYNGSTIGTAQLSGGFAAIGYAVSLPAGTYNVTVSYGGDSTHNTSSTTLALTVD